MSDINDFITHSQYPQEQIVWVYEGVVDNTNPYWDMDWDYGIFVPVPDSIDASNLLVDGVWSADNWTTIYPINATSRVYGWYQDGQSYYEDFDACYADTVKDYMGIIEGQSVYVVGDTSNGKTVQVRLWAYLTSTDTTSYITTKTAEQLASKLQKTTALAQMNLVSENIISVPDGGSVAIHHNLGFRPYCRIWEQNNMSGWSKLSAKMQITSGEPENDERIVIDNNKIEIYATDPLGFGDDRVFDVRIYGYAIPE